MLHGSIHSHRHGWVAAIWLEYEKPIDYVWIRNQGQGSQLWWSYSQVKVRRLLDLDDTASRAFDSHDTDHAASLCPVPQPGPHFQQPFVTCHHHPASVATWKLNYLAGPMTWTSTFVVATCYSNWANMNYRTELNWIELIVGRWIMVIFIHTIMCRDRQTDNTLNTAVKKPDHEKRPKLMQ